jgi:hypothetical protein
VHPELSPQIQNLTTTLQNLNPAQLQNLNGSSQLQSLASPHLTLGPSLSPSQGLSAPQGPSSSQGLTIVPPVQNLSPPMYPAHVVLPQQHTVQSNPGPIDYNKRKEQMLLYLGILLSYFFY